MNILMIMEECGDLAGEPVQDSSLSLWLPTSALSSRRVWEVTQNLIYEARFKPASPQALYFTLPKAHVCGFGQNCSDLRWTRLLSIVQISSSTQRWHSRTEALWARDAPFLRSRQPIKLLHTIREGNLNTWHARGWILANCQDTRAQIGSSSPVHGPICSKSNERLARFWLKESPIWL